MQQQLPPGPASAARSSGTDAVMQSLTLSTNWNVGTGASNNYYAYQDLDFFPKNITIDAGDTITYHVGSGVGGDAHTVAFVPPGMKVPSPGDPADLSPAGGTTVDGTTFLNSGILVGGQTFTLHFPKAGTYRILCLFHEPAMVSTVVVQNAGAAYPHTAQYYLNTGALDEWQDFYEAAQSVALFPFANGGKTFAAGIDPGLVHFPPSDSTVLRYINTDDRTKIPAEGSITIKVGTVLTWVNETSNEPHTITFALAGQSSVPNIPPDPSVNVASSGITSYDGSHIVNSGTILGGQKFQLKFTKPGKYFYGCLYHDNSRMTGWVTVTP
jgi:plastocyanin